MDQIKTTNLLAQNLHSPADVKAMQFPFIKVEKLPWAQNGLWNGFEFYNMTGFHIHFNDGVEICHMQAWTLGRGETARFHNHTDKSFCEIHYCLSNGGGEGSMASDVSSQFPGTNMHTQRYFSDNDTAPVDQSAELTKAYVDAHSTKLIVPTMFEHGPLWKLQKDTKWRPQIRSNDTVDYPWHAWIATGFGTYKLPMESPLSESDQVFDLWLAFEFPSSAFQE
ncbi:Aldos-2-ulose dehydratase [Mycena venus]|uniref:Aldos-2-ulose dehydratase n=1 Tax=Mycena venus TaxID=2733690 RepID=A0A8H6Y934_9AGAR|nr:Aldos-2-ulose dehydratase [Mycena venus]